MNEIATYLIKAAIFSSIFAVIFHFTLRKTTHFTYSRFYLIVSIILSAILPAIDISFLSDDESGIVRTLLLEPVEIKSSVANSLDYYMKNFSIKSAVVYIFISVSILMILKLIITTLLLVVKIMNSKTIRMNGYRHVPAENESDAYSFFNYVITPLNQDLRILSHESVHAMQLHSIDLLLAELFIAVQWFNPGAWIIKKYIQETHEYLADKAVMEQNCDSAEYKMLLLNRAFRVQAGIVNQFNYSLLKRRFIMINKNPSSRISRLKALAVIPLLFLAVLLLNSHVSKNVILSADANSSIFTTDKQQNDKIYDKVETLPEFPGGQNAMAEFIIKNVKYPENAIKKGTQGKVFVSFVIEKDGSISGVKVAKGVEKELDDEAVRVIKSMPKWKPGKEKNNIVRVNMTLPIQFKLQ